MYELGRYEEIKELIEKYANDYGYYEGDNELDDEDCTYEDFDDRPLVDFIGVIDDMDTAIDSAEKFLGYKLSPSYKWWLKNYGGGYTYGEEIYTLCYEKYPIEKDTKYIINKDYFDLFVTDIINYNNLEIKNGRSTPDKLLVSIGIDVEFYFDINKKDETTGEYPIYEFFSETFYAKDFIEFLKRRILEVY